MRHPVIGIFSALHESGGILPIYRTTAHYIEQIQAAGGVPVQIPLVPDGRTEDLATYLNLCDGILLPGGGDFDPDWYGETLLPGLQPDGFAIDRRSQALTLAFIRQAVASGKPILGICLGVQVLNVALGGSLYQDIASQIPTELHHTNRAVVLEERWKTAHSVEIQPDSLLASIVGEQSIPVNSFHHQAIREPAPGLRATAWAADGIVEALEHENGRVLGVQWHPENLAHAGIGHGVALFEWLVKESGKTLK